MSLFIILLIFLTEYTTIAGIISVFKPRAVTNRACSIFEEIRNPERIMIDIY